MLVESGVQVLSKVALLESSVEVTVGRADDPNVDGFRARCAEWKHFVRLQHAQEFRLRGHGHVADLVEEQRSVVGG